MLYNNPGKKLKKLVSLVIAVLMMVWVIFGIVIFGIVLILDENSLAEALLGLLLGAVVAGIGCLFTWISGLVIGAFADLADNAWQIREKLCGQTQEE